MDIEKLFKEFVEKEWHDGLEPQGGYDHYDEDEELDEKFEKEARSYIDRKKKEKEKKDYKKKYGREPFSFSGKHMDRKHSMGIAAEFDPDLGESQIGTGDQESRALIATKAKWAMRKALKSGKKQSQAWWNKQVRLADIDANDKPAAVLQKLLDTKEEVEEDFTLHEFWIGEGYKDLPPHLQKLVKKIEKKQ